MSYVADVQGDLKRLENELKSVQASHLNNDEQHEEQLNTLQAELITTKELNEHYQQELNDIKEKYSATCR